MTVTIKLVGPFQINRFKEDLRNYPSGICVREVVEELKISKHLLGIVLINGVHAGVEDQLNEGDTLSLLPFIDGG
jgi:sulfur carrier protein ThiS